MCYTSGTSGQSAPSLHISSHRFLSIIISWACLCAISPAFLESGYVLHPLLNSNYFRVRYSSSIFTSHFSVTATCTILSVMKTCPNKYCSKMEQSDYHCHLFVSDVTEANGPMLKSVLDSMTGTEWLPQVWLTICIMMSQLECSDWPKYVVMSQPTTPTHSVQNVGALQAFCIFLYCVFVE